MRSPITFGGRLRALRLAKGLSQVALARQIGRHQTAIGPYERDEYAPPREIVERLAALLDTAPEYLLFGRVAGATSLPVVGIVGPGGVRRAEREGTQAVRALRADRLVAFELEDDAMSPALRPGQLILCAAEPLEDPGPHLGRIALVTLRDGRRLLRRLAAGSRRGVVSLAALSAPPLVDVAISAFHLVLGALEPEALDQPRRLAGSGEPSS